MAYFGTKKTLIIGLKGEKGADGVTSYNDLTDKPTINGQELAGNIEISGGGGGAGELTDKGGFQAGTSASATSGGAVGNGAIATGGGAVGSGAKSGDGGAVGSGAKSAAGAAVGAGAKSTGYGAALGYNTSAEEGGAVGGSATATNGGAVGSRAKTEIGAAIGINTYSKEGAAIGAAAETSRGVAIGYGAKSRYAADGTTELYNADAIGNAAKVQANKACQLGTGTNANEGTLQFRSYQLLDANGKIPSERLPESAFTSLASGQSIDKLVFNPNVSVEKMTNYLASLPYSKTFQGLNSVTNLLDLGNDLAVWAINFGAFSGAIAGTSGYGIAIIDVSGESAVLKQAIFASEYAEANLTLINAIKDANYTLNYTQAGWSDTNDYTLDTANTIASVHDNKVSAFIGRDSRFFEVVEMLEKDTKLNEYTATITTDTAANVERLYNIVTKAKSLGIIAINGAYAFHLNSSASNNHQITFIRWSFTETNARMQGYMCQPAGPSNRFLQMIMSATGNTIDSTNTDAFTVTITYFNDVEIT